LIRIVETPSNQEAGVDDAEMIQEKQVDTEEPVENVKEDRKEDQSAVEFTLLVHASGETHWKIKETQALLYTIMGEEVADLGLMHVQRADGLERMDSLSAHEQKLVHALNQRLSEVELAWALLKELSLK
jgi:hypothetical protein